MIFASILSSNLTEIAPSIECCEVKLNDQSEGSVVILPNHQSAIFTASGDSSIFLIKADSSQEEIKIHNRAVVEFKDNQVLIFVG